MFLLLLAWTLWTVSLWTSGSGQILLQEPVKIVYPMILSTESIECDCSYFSCDAYWFRSISNQPSVQFLGKCNSANRTTYGYGVNTSRFKLNRKGGSVFTLRIVNVTEEDAGIYSCVLQDRRDLDTQMWRPGVFLRPGVIPTTLPPPTLPPVKPVCRCPKKNPPPAPEDCGSLVLWSLVGLIAALALVLICILYYFSRLPKKCRHHFVKRR